MKNKLFIFLYFIFILAGIGSIIAGAVLFITPLIFIGIGIIIAFSIAVTAITVIKGLRRASQGSENNSAPAVSRDNNVSASDPFGSETDPADDTFTSGSSTGGGLNGNIIDDNANMIAQSINQARNAGKHGGWSVGEKIFSIIAVVLFLICVVLCIVFGRKGNMTVTMICFGVAFLSILTLIIYAVISQSSLMDKKLLKTGERATGVVTGCIVASETSVNGRVSKVVYRVVLEVYGETKIAFSRMPYAVGTSLTVAYVQGKRRAAIVDNT